MKLFSLFSVFRILSILVIFTLSSVAQDKGAEAPKGLTLEFLMLAPQVDSVEFFLTDEKLEDPIGPIRINSIDFSQPIEPKSKMSWLAIKDPKSDGKLQKICALNLERAASKWKVLLQPAEKGVRALFVNGKDSGFKKDATLFVNTTNVPIAMKLDGDKKIVPARQQLMSPPPDKKSLPYYTVEFFYPTADGIPKLFADTRWPFLYSARNYVFFFVHPSTNTIAYRMVEESLPRR